MVMEGMVMEGMVMEGMVMEGMVMEGMVMLEASTPAEQAMSAARLARVFALAQRHASQLHSLLVVRNGRLVREQYWPPNQRNTKHILNSCTKAVLSTLVGIAVALGHLSESDRALDFFPEYAALGDDRQRRITVRHLLTMSSGISWPQYGPDNVSDAMSRSDDWVRFILERPMAVEPGAVTNYSNGDSHMLAAILERATGGSALAFAQAALFEPLEIHDASWDCDPQGRNIGSAAMYLTPADMAKFGVLYLSEGMWQGRRIVSRDWIARSLSQQTRMPTKGGAAGYGYYWWLYPERGLCEAWGGAGQRIAIFPARSLVVVMTAEIDDDSPRSELAGQVYDGVLAAITVEPERTPQRRERPNSPS
jgi:CubicO group peptidase (beta-lactamase class C family)